MHFIEQAVFSSLQDSDISLEGVIFFLIENISIQRMWEGNWEVNTHQYTFFYFSRQVLVNLKQPSKTMLLPIGGAV